MIVAKFGGGLLNGAEGLLRVRDAIAALPRPLVVVASAFGHVTNQLESIATEAINSESRALELLRILADEHRAVARDVLDASAFDEWRVIADAYVVRLEEIVHGLGIVHELSPRTMDLTVSFGEHLSSATLYAALRSAQVPAQIIPATELIITDNRHRFARPNINLTRERVTSRLLPLLTGDNVVVTEGYIARSASGETTTMGRESSDYSATLLAELLGASEVRIYTAVPGILTADPSIVDEARTLKNLSYAAARTLGELGAKILHPRTVLPLEQAGIPLIIRSLTESGTTINSSEQSHGSSIALLPDASMVTVHLPAVSTNDDAFISDLSSRVPLVWRSRFRHRLQLVTAARVDRDALALKLIDGNVEAEVVDGAVVSLVRQQGIDANDLARFFDALGTCVPLAVLGGIEPHAVGVFVDAYVDAVPLVRSLHATFADGQS
ncbi:MAG: aspartate kinase [bacterium]|nr:aspartate kinase [Candidatus Kapabacteria bacterium]